MLQDKILDYKDDVVKSIQEAIRIKSVEEAPLPGMPFGEGPAKALVHFLELGEKLGFESTNFDNYAGHIDFGDGEETLAILGHVDVVPEGEGWDHDPYGGIIADGKIYGRGTLDDKGPMIMCMYAMKALKDSGLKLNKKIRMILGANEETNWGCMDHYFGTLEMPQPTLAFTPDSSFPVTFAEKGIMQVTMTKNIDTKNITIEGGKAFNSVAESCEMVFPAELLTTLEAKVKEYNENNEYKMEIKDGKLISYGKSSHGARPQSGYNAISALMGILEGIDLGEISEFVTFYNSKIGMELNGVSMGIGFEDADSGKLSLNIGKLSIKDGKIELSIDMRYPVTTKKEAVLEGLGKTAAENNFVLTVKSESNALYFPKDTVLVKTLMDVYKEITGDVDAEPVAIGGGTYARAVDNGVAFGALLHDQEDNMHQKNEYLEISKLDTLLKIYVEAIYRLAK
jgi:succinyl-diaminopimelate desuccinylase